MGNPARCPLYYESMTDEILLVQINPLERRQTRVHRSDAPRRAFPQAHRRPALGTVPRRRRIHEIRRSYLVGTWAEHVRQRDNRLTGADRRFKEQARGYAVGEPQVAHLFPACEGADQEAVDGQTPASPQSLRFPAVNFVAAQRRSSPPEMIVDRWADSTDVCTCSVQQEIGSRSSDSANANEHGRINDAPPTNDRPTGGFGLVRRPDSDERKPCSNRLPICPAI